MKTRARPAGPYSHPLRSGSVMLTVCTATWSGGARRRAGWIVVSACLALMVACEGPADSAASAPVDAGGEETCAPPPFEMRPISDLSLEIDVAARAPHWGSAAHGDGGCGGESPSFNSTKFADWSVFRWPGCHETVYYQIEASIPEDWIPAIDAAFAAWDIPELCSPHWVNVNLGPPGVDAKVHVERNGPHCAGGGVWFACVVRDRAVSMSDQHWWLNFNDAEHPMGVGVTDAFDVQSLTSVELAHIHYLAHAPRFEESVSMLNNCRWGAKSCNVTGADSCGWSSSEVYTATCDNCGDRRSLLSADVATLHHIYGDHPDACSEPGEIAYECENCCGPDSCGYVTRRCLDTHRWSEETECVGG